MGIDLVKSLELYIDRQNNIVEHALLAANKFNSFTTVPFDFHNIGEGDLRQFDFNNVLYYFSIKNYGSSISSDEFCKRISQIKKGQALKLPRVNSKNAILSEDILYVGKSSGNFKTRLKQHLGLESNKTYALHLNSWKSDTMLSGIELELHYSQITFNGFAQIGREESLAALEVLESALHLQFEPLLGRSGH